MLLFLHTIQVFLSKKILGYWPQDTGYYTNDPTIQLIHKQIFKSAKKHLCLLSEKRKRLESLIFLSEKSISSDTSWLHLQKPNKERNKFVGNFQFLQFGFATNMYVHACIRTYIQGIIIPSVFVRNVVDCEMSSSILLLTLGLTTCATSGQNDYSKN
jgi:hypothetical protein